VVISVIPGTPRAGVEYSGNGHRIQERVQAGLAAARHRGRPGGLPAVIDAEKLSAVVAALDAGATKAAVCRTFGVKRSTLLDSLARMGWSAAMKAQEA
jgi:DNA invertase Pin-like site-specific DNA recombinase